MNTHFSPSKFVADVVAFVKRKKLQLITDSEQEMFRSLQKESERIHRHGESVCRDAAEKAHIEPRDNYATEPSDANFLELLRNGRSLDETRRHFQELQRRAGHALT